MTDREFANFLARYTSRQLENMFPSFTGNDALDVRAVQDAVHKTHRCVSSAVDFDSERFDHLRSGHHATFLYFLSRQLWLEKHDKETATRLFLLNKALNGIDLFYEVVMPDLFLIGHTVGMVFAKARYANYCVFHQGVHGRSEQGRSARARRRPDHVPAVVGDRALRRSIQHRLGAGRSARQLRHARKLLGFHRQIRPTGVQKHHGRLARPIFRAFDTRRWPCRRQSKQRMSLKRSLVANYLGQGWAAVMGIAFVPLYVKILGAESYGLIGVFAVLQAWIGLLDMGLTPTLNREMVRFRAKIRCAGQVRDLLRSLETIFALLALAIIVVLWFSAQWLAQGWLHVGELSEADMLASLRLMAFVLAARWIEQVYRGALQGLGDHVWLNTIQAALATLRWGGAYAVLVFVTADITAFFVWQGLVSLLTTSVLVVKTYHLLPPSGRPTRFSIVALREVRQFASGMFFVTILGVLLTQSDKLIISKLLPLDQLGYYMLAYTLSGGLLQLIAPMNSALYPKLMEFVAREDASGLQAAYLQACEWMAVILIPISLLLSVFPETVLVVWTGDSVLARNVSAMLVPLTLGTLLNGLMNLPYMLQLAHGWTALAVKVNALAVLLVVPGLFWAVSTHGAVGAAYVWLTLNVVSFLITAQVMYRKLLTEAKWRWYRSAVLSPLAVGAIVAVLLHAVMDPAPSSRLIAAAQLLSAGLVVSLAVGLSLLSVRLQVASAFARFR